MDKRIRRNEICVKGLPRCDFVFSSSRACFIAYGFRESSLEMTILRNLLGERGIQPEEAGGSLAPGQDAFCVKICSKILTCQFCIILLNNDEEGGRELPNPNVHMEYGLMLGFNKYVIPFQRASQTLPFNVAGLDTVKYTDKDFEHLASKAIDQAIEATRQDAEPAYGPDQVLEAFLLAKNALVSPLDTDGDKAIYRIGQPLGFNLLNDFSGFSYIYFGNFTSLRPEAVLWRVRKLDEILVARISSLNKRLDFGLLTKQQLPAVIELIRGLRVWIVVTSTNDKRAIMEAIADKALTFPDEVFSLEDIRSELEQLVAGRA